MLYALFLCRVDQSLVWPPVALELMLEPHRIAKHCWAVGGCWLLQDCFILLIHPRLNTNPVFLPSKNVFPSARDLKVFMDGILLFDLHVATPTSSDKHPSKTIWVAIS